MLVSQQLQEYFGRIMNFFRLRELRNVCIFFLPFIFLNYLHFAIIMQKLSNSIAKNVKNLISLTQFKAMRDCSSQVLTIEIGKEPSTLFKNSLWVGYRNGGMASWLATLLPHLPHQKFCLYMDEDSYRGSEYMYAYYTEYFSKLFHKQYLGTCVHPRKLLSPKQMAPINEIQAKSIHNELIQSSRTVVLLDLRPSDAAKVQCLSKEASKFRNTSYINLPLSDEDLPQLFHNKTHHLASNTKFITCCAKGYRSLIGYSYLQLIKKPEWDVQLCRNPFEEIKKQLNKPVLKSAQAQSQGMNLAQLAFL